ncbi:MAG: 4-hydroxythreonine-4-phosphate dehydrogenase PdxA [Balneolaceae bacterium]
MKPTIAITIGDFNGVGPEIILKALSHVDLTTSTPLILAPKEVLDFYARKLSLKVEMNVCSYLDEIDTSYINLLNFETDTLDINPGFQTEQSGLISMNSIELGIELTKAEISQALVTAPISKEAVNLAGFKIPGHTEFLADKTDTESVLMMLVNDGLRVALATAHVPISKVSSAITESLILEKLGLLHESLKKDFNITDPKIAVLGLNPHAGDGGVIGSEEIDTIVPALEKASQSGLYAAGPFPADGFFGQKLYKNYDAILAMYHDQGLAPFKLLSFGSGVNFTAGLPIIRTSPDHGTAFDIAGFGKADESSFVQAYELAVDLANRRYETE